MIPLMFRHLNLALTLVLALALAGSAQSSSSVIINSDLRLFITMTALNAAGFDVELGAQYHPVRQASREMAKQLSPELISRLRAFYQTHKREQSDDTQLSKYISLAVSLTDPPGMRLPAREEYLPPDARDVLGFVDLMREVYGQLKFTATWAELRPQYDAEINRLGPSIRDLLVRTDAYLRVPFGGPSTKSLDVLVELAAPINSVNIRSDQDEYFVVLGQSTTPHFDDIRHAYLHYQMDTMVALNTSKVANGPALLDLVKGVEGVQPAYTASFHTMMVESLIRALEIRMDRVMAAKARETIDAYYRGGLLLAPYFYESLQGFELQDAGIRDVGPKLMAAIKVGDEQARFAATFMKIPVSQKALVTAEVPVQVSPIAPNPMRDLLKEGEAALNENNSAKAKAAFEKVIAEYDRNSGAALYGLALIASREDQTERAKDYFERTTRAPAAPPSMKVWAYIYLGRIFDLECARPKALEYYQQAVKVADNTRNAQDVAKEGIKKPYGDGCLEIQLPVVFRLFNIKQGDSFQ